MRFGYGARAGACGMASLEHGMDVRALVERDRVRRTVCTDQQVFDQRLIHLAGRHAVIEKRRVTWSGSSEALDADRELWHRYLGV